jgi:hypothetical protein
MQGTAEFLYGTGIPKTLERMSYGDSLFSGSGMTLRPKEETINATMNVAPFAPAVGRLASRAIKATEGMPVGMSIKDVSPKIGINVNQGGSSFADKIISGEKKFETRESDSLRSYVGKRVGIIRTGEGKAKAIGDVTLGEPIVVSSPEEFAKLRDLHLVPEGSKFDIKEGGVKYLYPIENPVPYGVEKDVAKYGIVSRKILGEPDTLEKAIYPQQAALDLAQQRAALPVEQGGLGLPVNNTAADRAAAMGFDVEAYHGTASKDIQKFMPEGGTPEGEKTLEWYKNRQAQNEPVGYMAFRGGSFFSPKADYAGSYAPEGTGVMYPVNLRMENPLSLLPNAQGRYSATNAPDINKTIDAMILQDSLNKSINEIAIIDPAQIRSRFAAYDPFRRNVATATAMGVALPDLLAQPVNQYQNPYETLPMYTDPFGNTIGSSIR